MKKICVFCGSRPGKNPKFITEAKKLGKLLAENNIGLVYGGASIGIMAAVADSVLEHGGKVWGVMPELLIEREVAHKGLTELISAKNMHERKAKLYEMSDGFVALPGGMGTLDELCEIVTWRQLKQHSKPCYILNTDGFYDAFIKHIEEIRDEGLMNYDDFSILDIKRHSEEIVTSFIN